MKFDKFLIVIIITIIIYGVFLFISDFNLVYEKITNFKIIFVPVILSLISLNWVVRFYRWHILLKNSNIHVPIKNNFMIYLASLSLSITPGQIGELIKSEFLKKQFKIPRSKTLPIIFIEKFYDLMGVLIASIIGVWYFEGGSYLISIGIVLLVLIFVLILSRSIFEKVLLLICKIKFFSKYQKNFLESYNVLRNSLKTKIGLKSVILSFIFWVIQGIAVYFILLALGINELNFLIATSANAISVLIGALSFVPGGLGVTEASMGGLLSLQGIEISFALITAVIIRIFTSWYTVVAGFIALKFSGGFSLNEQN
jgi:uncharacterized protein (TIRG00374 family)